MISCPHCNTTLNLEQLSEDKSARQVLGLLSRRAEMAYLCAYLGLFKPRKQALRWTRYQSLLEDLLNRWGNDPRLARALADTVEALRERRQQDNWRPLKDHNYFKAVLESLPMHSPAQPLLKQAQPDTRKPREIPLQEQLTDTSWAK